MNGDAKDWFCAVGRKVVRRTVLNEAGDMNMDKEGRGE